MRQHGFTLVELLVSIAIVGILAALSLANYETFKANARDAQRHLDVRNIMTAMEAYYADNSKYPTTGGAGAPNGSWTNSGDGSWNTFKTTLGSAGTGLPLDPTNDSSGWAYGGSLNYAVFSRNAYGCDHQWYMIAYGLEGGNYSNSPGVRACNGQTFNYANTITIGQSGR